MASKTYKPIKVRPDQWLDLVAEATSQNTESLAGKDLQFQLRGGTSGQIVFGGATAPSGVNDGLVLNPGQPVNGSAVDRVWVKAAGLVVPHED